MAGSPYAFITQTDIGPGGEGLVNTTAAFPAVTVDPATLTVSDAGLTPDNKIYDGTTTATLAIGTPTLVGVVGADSVSLVTSSATGTFADKDIGTAKTVTIAGLTLTGANAGNYYTHSADPHGEHHEKASHGHRCNRHQDIRRHHRLNRRSDPVWGYSSCAR